MGQPLTLESFEFALAEQSGPSADYDQGYQEGLAAGIATAQADASNLTDAFVQAFMDINFTFAEASAENLKSLVTLFEAITEKLLPEAIEVGFQARVIEQLISTAEHQLNQPIQLHVHPNQAEAIGAITQRHALKASIHPDASLSLNMAWIQQGQTETLLDVDGLLRNIKQVIEVVVSHQDREDSNG